MKKVFLLIISLIAMSQCMAEGKQLTAVFSYSTFALSDGSPYVETYLSFDAWNMNFVSTGKSQYRATVEIVLVVKRSDSVTYAKKYDLQSPAIDSPEKDHFNFLDVQRFSLSNGIYDLVMTVKDKASQNGPITITEKLVVNYDDKTPRLSSVQTMAKATKTTQQNILSRNGYDMEPYVNDFYPEQIGTLNFYYEIYNIQKEIGNQDFLNVCFIEQQENGQRYEAGVVTKRMKSAVLVPNYASIDISQLPSGNYNLVVEVRNKHNELLLFKKTPFIRSNPSIEQPTLSAGAATFAGQITDENLLNYYIDALYPIATEREKQYADKIVKQPGKMEEKQTFFYNFWTTRNKLNPESAWREYRERLDYVAAHFSYPRTEGYKTDRGRIYLQYGAPSFVRDEKNFVSNRYLGSGTNMRQNITGERPTDNSLGQIYYLPYQLWRYNQLPGDDINRVFLFWDEFRSGYYKLLNSNAKGEVRDPKWEQRLSQQQLNEDVKGEVGEQFERGY
jgi:GWxTD domain-containing protein